MKNDYCRRRPSETFHSWKIKLNWVDGTSRFAVWMNPKDWIHSESIDNSIRANNVYMFCRALIWCTRNNKNRVTCSKSNSGQCIAVVCCAARLKRTLSVRCRWNVQDSEMIHARPNAILFLFCSFFCCCRYLEGFAVVLLQRKQYWTDFWWRGKYTDGHREPIRDRVCARARMPMWTKNWTRQNMNKNNDNNALHIYVFASMSTSYSFVGPFVRCWPLPLSQQSN